MAFIPAVDVIRVSVEMNSKGDTVVNVYHIFSNRPVTVAVLNDVVVIFKEWFTSSLRGLLDADTSITRLTVRDLTTQASNVIDETLVTPIPGTVTNTGSSPNQVALVVSGRTGLAGRSYRSRSYLGPTPRGVIAGNLVNVTYQALVLAAMQRLQDELADDQFQFGVLSLRNNKNPRPAGVFTAFTSFVCNRRVDTQRKRLNAVSG